MTGTDDVMTWLRLSSPLTRHHYPRPPRQRDRRSPPGNPALAAARAAADTNKGMSARLVLVHSPLVGPATWEPVAADLAGRGFQVSVPDLTGTVAAGPPFALRQAE